MPLFRKCNSPAKCLAWFVRLSDHRKAMHTSLSWMESVFLVLLDGVSLVTWFNGPFWPLNWLKLEEVHLVWEESGRRKKPGFSCGCSILNSECLYHSVYFWFCSRWLLYSDTVHCHHEPAFSQPYGSHSG